MDYELALHHVAVQTDDFDRSLGFYRDVLGLEPGEIRQYRSRLMVWLRIGDAYIELYSVKDGESLQPWSQLSGGPVHFAIEVRGFDVYLERALLRGATFVSSHPGPFVPSGGEGKRIAFLEGPNGEEIEVRDAG